MKTLPSLGVRCSQTADDKLSLRDANFLATTPSMKILARVKMLWASSVALLLCIFLLSRGSVNAQGNPEGTRGRPLISAVSEILFLGDARDSLARARNFESKQAVLDAALEYEALITRSEKLPEQLRLSYEFYIVLAGARLDAARTRMALAPSFDKNLDLHDQNHARIGKHLNAVPGLVVAAAEKTAGLPELEKFRCNAFKLLAYGQFLRGLQNGSSKDLNGAVATYKSVVKCDPSSASQTQDMISYTKSVERDVSKSYWRADNVAKLVSESVKTFVPKVGSHLSFTIDLAYGHYKETRKAPIPPPLR